MHAKCQNVDLYLNSLSIAIKYKEEDMSRFLALGVASVALLAFAATAQAQYPGTGGQSHSSGSDLL